MRLDHLLSKELTIIGCPLPPRVLVGGLLMGGISMNYRSWSVHCLVWGLWSGLVLWVVLLVSTPWVSVVGACGWKAGGGACGARLWRTVGF